MLPSELCDDCTPSYLQRRGFDSVSSSTLFLSSIPLILTWAATVTVAQTRLLPVLSNDVERKDGPDGLPLFNKDTIRHATTGWKERLRKPSVEKLASVVFSTSIGLSAVLVELLLCEISNTLHPAARALALRITLACLLALIVAITPGIVIHGFVKTFLGSQSEGTSTRKTRTRMRMFLEGTIFKAWLLVFWYIPQASLLRNKLHTGRTDTSRAGPDFSEACLERVGIIGISLMASLAGFAAVSSLWQTFGVRPRIVRDVDLSRKAAGLKATEEMLAAKQSRVRALRRKINETGAPSDQRGFVNKVIGSFRGSSETQELKALEMEVMGLETMRFTLSNSLSTLQSRHAEQERLRSRFGKLLRIFNLAFAIYCAYRIGTTSFAVLRRWLQPATSSATSDPINNLLAVLTTHWDSNLDRAAWSRQISFFLSGIMLLASFNAVLQTFRLFARFAPKLIQHAQTSLPLVISQIAGTYVISSALLLRSNLPEEVSSVITEALGAPLEGRFVESWFENWFLVAVAVTAIGIFVGRRFSNNEEDWDDSGVEVGKLS